MITLDQANRMVAGALEKGREMGLKPLTVAVLDGGGHLVALARQDGSSLLRPAIAIGKAAGALALGTSSRAVAAVAAERPAFIASLHALSPGGVVPAAGGVLIADDDGRLLGAVGVSGDLSDNDELCALAGLTTGGLRAPD